MTREEAVRWLEIEKSIIREVPEQPQGARELTEAYDMAIEALSADAVSLTGTMKYLTKPHNYCEVVRCKDCRWWNGNPETMHNNHLCRNWSKFGSINTSADDFCSHGERREECV